MSNNKMTTREKVKEIFFDKKYWQPAKPPTMAFIAKKLNLTRGAVHRYVKEFSTVK